MRKIVDREQAIRQLDLVAAGKGGDIVPMHLPRLVRIYQALTEDREIDIDDRILLGVYRDRVRHIHLINLNHNHPRYGHNKGHPVYKSAEHRAKLSKAQKGKKHSPERIAARVAKAKATWAAKRAAKK